MLAAAVAEAVIPLASRTMSAIAGVNRAAGRTQALRLEVTMRIGDEPPIASGELISHPSGLARLELRGYEGRIDRYLLTGDELQGTMNGRSLSEPRPLLQPFFLLQPSTGATLHAALDSFGIRTDSIGFAPCGDDDCLVIGDPRLAAPRIAAPPVVQDPSDASEEGSEDVPDRLDPLAGRVFEPVAPLLGGELADQWLPRFWVDAESLEVRRIDRGDGVFVIFGPMARFDRIEVPGWIEIHEAGRPSPIRFEVDRAVQVNAPAKAFNRSWLIPSDLETGGLPEDPA